MPMTGLQQALRQTCHKLLQTPSGAARNIALRPQGGEAPQLASLLSLLTLRTDPGERNSVISASAEQHRRAHWHCAAHSHLRSRFSARHGASLGSHSTRRQFKRSSAPETQARAVRLSPRTARPPRPVAPPQTWGHRHPSSCTSAKRTKSRKTAVGTPSTGQRRRSGRSGSVTPLKVPGSRVHACHGGARRCSV